MEPDELARLQIAADAELRLYQKLQAEHEPVEPLEAKPYIPYTDSADFRNGFQAIQKMRETQEIERQARIESEKRTEKANRKLTVENRIWNTVIVVISLLTLAATILGVLK